MPDYTKYIPELNATSGMLIRDTGYRVELWFVTQPDIAVPAQKFGIQANGAYTEKTFNLEAGGRWQMFDATFVSTEQEITFRIFGNGTNWPTTDFTVTLLRGAAPTAPPPPIIYTRAATSIDVGWGGDGFGNGLPITSRELWYSYDNTPRYIVSTGTGRVVVGNLVSGGMYNFWTRNGNAKGWSPYSEPTVARAYRVPDAPLPVVITNVRQDQFDFTINYTDRWDGGTLVSEYQVLYSLTSGSGYTTQAGYAGTIKNLSPGKTYYVVSRAVNSVGASPLSVETSVRLKAGGFIKQGATTQRMIPWVKDAGVWKPTRSYVNVDGVWKEAGS